LLHRERTDYVSFDNVNLVGTTLRRWRDPSEFDEGSGNPVPGMTPTEEKTEEQEQNSFSGKTARGCACGPLPPVDTTKANFLAAAVVAGQLYPRRAVISVRSARRTRPFPEIYSILQSRRCICQLSRSRQEIFKVQPDECVFLAYHDGGTPQKDFCGSEKPFHLVMHPLLSIAQSSAWT
jgi:hypothetical protein